jgi:hypothetical protein
MKITGDKGPKNKVTFKTKDVEGHQVMSPWWEESNEDKAASLMLSSTAFLKETQNFRYKQTALYARLYGTQSLFGFAGTNMDKQDNNMGLSMDRPTFNLIQSTVDTLVSRISQNRPSPRFITDNGDYKQRNLAKKLDNFISGEFYKNDVYEVATDILRDALVLGTGIAHTFETQDNRVGIERVLLTELFVDPNESMYGNPRQMYRVKLVDRDILMDSFPKLKRKIEEAVKATPDQSATASKTVADQVLVVEAWHLKSGKDAADGYHMMACSAGCLIMEEYDKDEFPFTFMHYSTRMLGFWGQGIAEQLKGTQIELNSILYTISKAIKLVGVPRVFVEEGSKVSKTSHNNEVGTIVTYKGVKPSYEIAPSNAPELYAERDKLIQYGYQQCGVSALQASSQKPQGLDSGEAIRSYDDISTDRFAALSRRFDNFFVDLAYQFIDLAKTICERDGKYSTIYPSKNGLMKIDLPAADILEDTFVIQCLTQSSLPKDPAGRLAKITEMVQSQMITMSEGRRLLDYPDLDQVEKLANAAEERILMILDDVIEHNTFTPPDSFMDLQLALTLTTQYINLYAQAKLPESKMQTLRDFFTQVQDQIQAAMPPPPMPMAGMPASDGPQATPIAPPTSALLPNAPGGQ